MINNIGYKGRFEIYINGKLEKIVKNKVTDDTLDELIISLYGETPDMEIEYLAVGTSNTPLGNDDTKLYNELFRTPYTSRSKTGIGEVTTEFTILDSEAVGQIEEIGIFGGSTASASADTGLLISRILWSKNKTNSEEIILKRIDKIVRG